MIEFGEEDYQTAWDDILKQTHDHYSEAYADEDYDPNLAEYEAIAAAGLLCVVTGRRAGALVAYSVCFVRTHLHQQSVPWGFVDSYWVRRDCRGPRVVLRLVQAVEDALRARGVRKVFATERTDGRLFAHMGYRAAERNYIKEL